MPCRHTSVVLSNKKQELAKQIPQKIAAVEAAFSPVVQFKKKLEREVDEKTIASMKWEFDWLRTEKQLRILWDEAFTPENVEVNKMILKTIELLFVDEGYKTRYDPTIERVPREVNAQLMTKELCRILVYSSYLNRNSSSDANKVQINSTELVLDEQSGYLMNLLLYTSLLLEKKIARPVLLNGRLADTDCVYQRGRAFYFNEAFYIDQNIKDLLGKIKVTNIPLLVYEEGTKKGIAYGVNSDIRVLDYMQSSFKVVTIDYFAKYDLDKAGIKFPAVLQSLKRGGFSLFFKFGMFKPSLSGLGKQYAQKISYVLFHDTYNAKLLDEAIKNDKVAIYKNLPKEVLETMVENVHRMATASDETIQFIIKAD